MKALVLAAPETIEIQDVAKPACGPGEALVRIKAAALNHRDQWCREGKYPNIQLGTVLGSDGAGVVEAVGSDSDNMWLDKEVLINPNNSWGPNPEAQSSEYNILGMPKNGTFAEYVVVDIDRLHPKPAYLEFMTAAAFPLGGLTAYRAVFKHGKIDTGKKILVTGIGGGVAQFAFLFAAAAGASVYVTSSKSENIEAVIQKGAQGGFNYKDSSWVQKALKEAEGFDVVIDSAGGDQFNELIKLVKPGGRIVFYGATTGVPNSLNIHKIFWSQITLQGSTMGNDQEFSEMLDFISKHKIEPIIDSVRPFDEIVSAFDDMKEGRQSGKLVVEF